MTINRLIESPRQRYQVFLGAVPFDSRSTLLELEDIVASKDAAIMENHKASAGKSVSLSVDTAPRKWDIPIRIPVRGEYQLVLRCRSLTTLSSFTVQTRSTSIGEFDLPNSEEFAYLTLHEQFAFSKGKQTITLALTNGEIDIDNLMVLPIRSGKNFPLDIAARVWPDLHIVPARFEAEDLPNERGKIVNDKASSGQLARKAIVAEDSPGFMVFGPYQKGLQPGATYSVNVRLKVEKNDNPEIVAVLDVLADASQVLAQKPVKGNDFAKPGEYQNFTIDFTMPDTIPELFAPVEFRIYFTGQDTLWADMIELRSHPGEENEADKS